MGKWCRCWPGCNRSDVFKTFRANAVLCEERLDVVLMKNSAPSVEVSCDDFDNIVTIVAHTLLTFSGFNSKDTVGIGFA